MLAHRKALKVIEKGLSIAPDHTDLNFHYISVLTDNGDLDDAYTRILAFEKKTSDKKRLANLAGWLLFAIDASKPSADLERAIKLYLRLSKEPERFRQVAGRYRSAGVVDRAIFFTERAIETEPNLLKEIHDLDQFILRRRGKDSPAYAKLAPLWEKVIKASKQPVRFKIAGDYYGRIGQVERVVELYSERYKLKPMTLDAYIRIARQLIDSGQSVMALKVVDLAVTQTTSETSERRNRFAGVIYGKVNLNDKAMPLYEKYLETQPKAYKLRERMADYYADKGDRRRAFRQWSVLANHERRYRKKIIAILISEENLPDALKQYRLLLGTSTGNAKERAEFAMVLYKAGQKKEALGLLMNPPNHYKYRLANAAKLESLGEQDAALKLYQKGIENVVYRWEDYDGFARIMLARKLPDKVVWVYKRAFFSKSDAPRRAKIAEKLKAAGYPTHAAQIMKLTLRSDPKPKEKNKSKP